MIPAPLAGLLGSFEVMDLSPPGWPAHFAFVLPGAEALRRWPGYPDAARPESGRAAAGRGRTAVACLSGGLGEAVELASSCRWGDETVLRGRAADFAPDEAILPDEWLGLTRGQMAARKRWNTARFGMADWRPAPLAPTRAIDWIAGRDAHSGALRWAPADLVLIGRSPSDPEALGIADTRGCAAGATSDAALLHALRELAERDAVGRWWHAMQPAPTLPHRCAELDAEMAGFLRDRARHTRFLRLAPASERAAASDPGGVVVAAASADPDGCRVALGFAARGSAAEAARDAAIEMLQTELGLQQREALGDPLARLWLSRVRAGRGPLAPTAVCRCPTRAEPDAAAEITLRLDRLAARGLAATLFDLTRPEFGVPVLRAAVPGLASDRPRWRAFGGRPANPFPLLV